MKHLMNLINVATEIIMHLYLLPRLPKHLQIIILDICIHQITLTLTEVLLPTYHLLIHIRTMVPDMVVLPTLSILLIIICNHQIILTLTEVRLPAYHIHILTMVIGMVVLPTLSLRIFIIIKDIMDTILVLEMIVGSLVEATIIKADHHHLRFLLISLHVLLHLWEPVITIVTVTVTVIGITEAKGTIIITEDQTLLVVVATGGGEIPNKVCGTIAGDMFIANPSF